jgi:hypothetical protein
MKNQNESPSLTIAQIDSARDFLDAERGRHTAELKGHVHAYAIALARNDVGSVRGVIDKWNDLRNRIALLDAVTPVFDELAEKLEHERAAALAEDRLATLVEIEIPAATKAFEAAKAEPKPTSHGGNGLIAVQKYHENIRGHEANVRQLERERAELESRVGLLRSSA